jgi:hypothetical protein
MSHYLVFQKDSQPERQFYHADNGNNLYRSVPAAPEPIDKPQKAAVI